MRTSFVFILLVGCGASSAAPTEASVTLPDPPAASASVPPPTTDGAVEARLGCAVLTRADVDRELLAAQKLSEKPPTREVVRDRMIRAVVVKKLAREREVTVEPSEIDGGIAAMAAASNITSEQLMASVREHGIDEASYRAGVAEQVLEAKLRLHLSEGASDRKAVIGKSDAALEKATRELAASKCDQ
jgi:hypothetical protein